MKYICNKDFTIKGYLIGSKGNTLLIEDTKPEDFDEGEYIDGTCWVENLTTQQTYLSRWEDIHKEALQELIEE